MEFNFEKKEENGKEKDIKRTFKIIGEGNIESGKDLTVLYLKSCIMILAEVLERIKK